jgi:hypothetical protein
MGCMNSRADDPSASKGGPVVEAKASAAVIKPGMERITKDMVADSEFETVADIATTYKFFIHRR